MREKSIILLEVIGNVDRSSMNEIRSIEELEEIYGGVNTNALKKETLRLTAEYRKWVEKSQFFAIASQGPEGMDCSPRGDASGQLIKILDDRTIAIPDRRGNNRLDTLRNIISDNHVALLFFISGVSETMRINGKAVISTDPDLIADFSINNTKPKSVIIVKINAVYFQCARALVRSELWNIKGSIDVPTAGQMTKSATPEFDADTYDAELKDRVLKTLY